MAKIRRVYDDTIKPDGSRLTIYPITSSKAVYTPTGVSLNTILNEGYRFGGVVEPDDRPAFLDQRVWYLGTTAGTYAAFGDVTIGEGVGVALFWDCQRWSAKSFALGGGGGGSSVAVINNLNSSSTTDALSAAMGKELKRQIDNITPGGEVGTLNTNNTSAQSASNSESFGGTIKLHKISKTGNYNDLLNKPTIPAAVTETTVSGWGFTKNTGTVTKVKINGSTYNPVSGVVDLGNQGGGGASQLNDLSDVTLSSPTSGNQLVFNGSKWVNGAVGNMNYMKVTSAQYASMQQGGTLQSNILYIIVD